MVAVLSVASMALTVAMPPLQRTLGTTVGDRARDIMRLPLSFRVLVVVSVAVTPKPSPDATASPSSTTAPVWLPTRRAGWHATAGSNS
jgi:hypothetical protein